MQAEAVKLMCSQPGGSLVEVLPSPQRLLRVQGREVGKSVVGRDSGKKVMFLVGQ